MKVSSPLPRMASAKQRPCEEKPDSGAFRAMGSVFKKDTAPSLHLEKRTLSRGCRWWKQQSAKKWPEEGEKVFRD